MASDENTVKVAQELDIPYVIARGTTDTKATVYKPQEYDVKILSISNIALATFKFGSLCDYSFYERSGTPQDMLAELNRAYEPMSEKEKEWSGEFHRVTPTTHTNIGGYLKPWMDMWISFWDSTETEWVDLDTFMNDVDWEIPMWQVPTNRNAPYTPEKIRPITPYDEIEKIENPCKVEDIGPETNTQTETNTNTSEIVIFHNGTGSMCIEALEFFEENGMSYTEHLTTDSDFTELLTQYRSGHAASEGESTTFGYYPIIFVGGKVFSGFNVAIENEIQLIMDM